MGFHIEMNQCHIFVYIIMICRDMYIFWREAGMVLPCLVLFLFESSLGESHVHISSDCAVLSWTVLLNARSLVRCDFVVQAQDASCSGAKALHTETHKMGTVVFEWCWNRTNGTTIYSTICFPLVTCHSAVECHFEPQNSNVASVCRPQSAALSCFVSRICHWRAFDIIRSELQTRRRVKFAHPQDQ